MKYYTYIIIILCILTGCSNKSTKSEKVPFLSFNPQSLTINSGQTGDMTIKIENFDEYIFGVTLQIAYDAAVVSFSDSSGFIIGDFFGADVVSFVEEDASVIHLALTLTQGQLEVNGSGEIGKFIFTGSSPGSSPTEIIPAELYFYDSEGKDVIIPDLEIEVAEITVQ